MVETWTKIAKKCDYLVHTLDTLAINQDVKGLVVFFALLLAKICVLFVCATFGSIAIFMMLSILVSLAMMMLTIVSVIVGITVPVCGCIVGTASIVFIWSLVGISCLLVPLLAGRAYRTSKLGKLDSSFDTIRTFGEIKTHIISKMPRIKIEKKNATSTNNTPLAESKISSKQTNTTTTAPTTSTIKTEKKIAPQ